MTDVQFAAFETAHPSAVIVNRCYIGQDPDLHIRSKCVPRSDDRALTVRVVAEKRI